MKNKVDKYGVALYVLDYRAIVLAAKMCTNFHEQSMHIRFL